SPPSDSLRSAAKSSRVGNAVVAMKWLFFQKAFRPLAGPTWSASVERTLVKPCPPRRPHADATSLDEEARESLR
ncbi:hypothetical protein, partial [Sphingomonas sp.]|uniref:hypothetical protein n=1 Tax=Sphingomonas sp. TaxID=28214 RepID=UPI00286B2E36